MSRDDARLDPQPVTGAADTSPAGFRAAAHEVVELIADGLASRELLCCGAATPA